MTIEYLDAKRVQGVGATGTTGWTVSSGDLYVLDPSNNEIDFTIKRNGTQQICYYDLGSSAIGNTWVLRMHLNFTGTSSADTYEKSTFFGFSSTTGAFNTSQDTAGLTITFAGSLGSSENLYRLSESDDQDIGDGDRTTLNTTFTPTDDYYVEIRRTDSTTLKAQLYSDSTYETTVGSEATNTNFSGTGLQYLKLATLGSALQPEEQTGIINLIKFYNNTTTASGDPTLSLLAGSDKATLLTDSLGSDGNATNNGADLDTTNEKLGTGCLDFNGSSDNINASNLQTNTAMTTKGTISMWVNFDDLTTGRKIWSIGDANANSFIYVEMESNGTLVAQCRLASTNQWKCNTSSGIVSTSGWYLVTITHNGTEPKIYVNGTEDTTFTVTTDKTKWANMTGLDEFYVGKGRYNGSDDGFLDGKTDDIGIWNDALIVGTDENTADSIKWLYNTGTGRLASTIPSGLRAYYNCDSATTNNNAVGSLLPENTIFNETDTYKQYWLQDNQWWYTNGTMVDTDLYLWYDASDLSTITKDGSNQVSQWNDKSGGGRHLTASGTGTDGMPLWVSAGQNGNNEIDFVNSKKMSKSGIELESTRTTFIVCKAGDNSGTDKSPLGFTDGGSYSADFYCPRIYTGGNQFYFNEIGTSEFTETGIINTWRQWTSLCKSGGSALRMGGVEKATNTTTGTDTPDAMNVGNNHLLNSDFNRPIGEIIIYNRELTTSEIESVEAYLKAKWGTP